MLLTIIRTSIAIEIWKCTINVILLITVDIRFQKYLLRSNFLRVYCLWIALSLYCANTAFLLF